MNIVMYILKFAAYFLAAQHQNRLSITGTGSRAMIDASSVYYHLDNQRLCLIYSLYSTAIDAAVVVTLRMIIITGIRYGVMANLLTTIVVSLSQ